jgi:uncharacterized phosphosugar-binding protein
MQKQMNGVTVFRGLLAVGLVALGMSVQCALAADDAAMAVLNAYKARLPAIRAALPVIVQSAEAAASRRVQATNSCVMLARVPDLGVAYELVSRAGGLAEIHHERGPGKGDGSNFTVLVSVPTWESNTVDAVKSLTPYRNKGFLIVLFGSRNGLATNVPADFVIDNGAASGSAADQTVNVLANATCGWLWCCEYTAALTRLGKRPGILKSMSYEDGGDFNKDLRTNARRLYDCTTVIPKEALANAYLARIEKMTRDIEADAVRTNLLNAADLVAAQLKAKRAVFTATCNHLLNPDISRNVRSGMQPFRPYNNGFSKTLKPGDLLVWFGYIGMDTANYQHGAAIRETGADFIACFAQGNNSFNEAPDAKVVIPQSWELGDAELDIPFPPGRMAPISGINQTLLYRMLDAAVVERGGVAQSKPAAEEAPAE